jgi:hypothetical protein
MKIAYVYYFHGQMLAGPSSKIGEQAKAAQEAGLDIDFIILHEGFDHVDGNVRYIRIPFTFMGGVLKKIEQTFFKYRLIGKLLDFDRYDGVLLRYPLTDDLTCGPFFHEFGHKIITEHNTHELAELKLAWNQDRSFFLRFFLEKANDGPMLSKVAGIIGVTEEIRRLEIEKAGLKPSAVIANGVNTESVMQTGFVPFDGKNLTLIFTFSEFVPWHGLDRILKGLDQYRGKTAVHLMLIGKISRKYMERINRAIHPPVTVHMPGPLYGSDLDAVFSRATLSISTLGLYRKRMKEACPLKSREYIARGIPFVYAYNDPDIPSLSSFCLKYENNDTPIDIERIIEFSHEIKAKHRLSGEMRQFARERLDWRVKLRQMYAFAGQVFKNTATAGEIPGEI